jgi:uncharacterized membrane protein YeaQ/YmgE (transglycosylase-associated protein family)
MMSPAMDQHHLIGWIVIGIVAGFLAARLVEGRGLGCFMNMLVGLAGAIVGGLLVDRLAPDSSYGFLGSIVVSFIGACIFLGVLRLLGIGGPRHPLAQGRLSDRRRW